MTLTQLRNHTLFQTNNDSDDLTEFQPAIDDYINEGYDRLTMAYANLHLGQQAEDGTTPYPKLTNANDACQLPAWVHRHIGDFAAYMIYRNGNALKQNRGIPYYEMFERARQMLAQEGRKARGGSHFYNLYVP